MPTVKVSRLETTTNKVTYEVELPDDYEEYDVADLDDLVTDKVISLTEYDEEVLDVIDTTSWKVES